MRLDRLVGKWANWGKRQTRSCLEAGKVSCKGQVIRDGTWQVGKFDRVVCDGEVIQDRIARYLMMNKPLGVVSATVDPEHETVVDLVKEEWARDLHLAGRLDRFTSGLLILTNDSQFSEALTAPAKKVGKRYLVTLDQPISSQMIADFERGLWFAKEQVRTAPAQVELLSSQSCRLTIYEGKHHQVKRMFARYDSKVMTLHREAMGSLELDTSLIPGQWRPLTGTEVSSVKV